MTFSNYAPPRTVRFMIRAARSARHTGRRHLAVVVATLACATAMAQEGPPPALVVTEAVVSESVTETIELPGEAPLLVCATPQGQRHELGALISGVVAAGLGWRPVFLGPDLPADEIAAATRQLRASAVARTDSFIRQAISTPTA